MDLDDEEQRRRLAAIEQDLSVADPRLVRRFDRLHHVGHMARTSWLGVLTSLALLLVDSEVFLYALAHRSWWLLILSTCLFTVVMYPTTRTMSRKGYK